MKFIYKGRRDGKTTTLIQEFKQDSNGLLVVCSADEKKRIIEKYDNLDQDRIISWNYLEVNSKYGYFRGNRHNLYFDNLDWYIMNKTGLKLKSFTMTYEDEDKDKLKKTIIPKELFEL